MDPEEMVPLLLTNRQTIQLNPNASMEVDVVSFDTLIGTTQIHDHLDLLTCHQCQSDLKEAVNLYQGDFLADFYLDDSNAYEDWSQAKRQAYRRQVLDALEVLTTIATRRKTTPRPAPTPNANSTSTICANRPTGSSWRSWPLRPPSRSAQCLRKLQASIGRGAGHGARQTYHRGLR